MRRKSSRFSRVAMALGSSFLIVCWLMGAPRLGTGVRAQAQTCAAGQTTITVVSGNGTVGGTDSVVMVSSDGGTTYQGATIVDPFVLGSYSWATPIAPSQWLSVDTNRGYGLSFRDFLFQTTFTLPAGFTNPSLAIQVHCDNVATIFLNGHQIGMQPDVEPNGAVANFQDPWESFTTTNAGFFVTGNNVLSFTVHNYEAQIGLDFRADICYTPAPATPPPCDDRRPPKVDCTVDKNSLSQNHQLTDIGFDINVSDDCDCFGDDEDNSDGDTHGSHGDSHGSHCDGRDGSDGHSSSHRHHGGGGGGGEGNHNGGGSGGGDDDDCNLHHRRTGSHSVKVCVYSDESDSRYSPDATDDGQVELRLRGERSSSRNGRVYLIVVSATDKSGRKGYACKTVTVPRDSSSSSRNAVESRARAAVTFFMNNGYAPYGYDKVGDGSLNSSR